MREALVAKVGCCMMCGARPVKGSDWPGHRLCVHEIANGPLRQKCLDHLPSLLVLCWSCNGGPANDASDWPEARQLALIKVLDPERYDLKAHNALVNPRAPLRITEKEVSHYADALRIGGWGRR